MLSWQAPFCLAARVSIRLTRATCTPSRVRPCSAFLRATTTIPIMLTFLARCISPAARSRQRQPSCSPPEATTPSLPLTTQPSRPTSTPCTTPRATPYRKSATRWPPPSSRTPSSTPATARPISPPTSTAECSTSPTLTTAPAHRDQDTHRHQQQLHHHPWRQPGLQRRGPRHRPRA